MARSLLDGIDVNEKPAPKGGSGMDKAKVKLFASIALLAVALAVLGYYYLVPDKPPVIEQPPPEEAARMQQQNEQQMQRAIESGQATLGGS